MAQELVGVIVLSVFAFYVVKLLNSFRNGVIAKSWRYVGVGTLFLIAAQFPVFVASGNTGELQVIMESAASAMRLLGVVFLIIGLRVQARLWSGQVSITSRSNNDDETIPEDELLRGSSPRQAPPPRLIQN